MSMTDQLSLDRVMSSPRLPTLPAVALRVLELSRDRNVRLAHLASAIGHDQALCVKMLRTINSSFYGLARPCPSIERAIAFLGLNAVRSLALGFSLVPSMDGGMEDGTVAFDFITYWRRAVYAACGARRLASQTRLCEPEEAFLGALLQDIGMVAMHRAAGEIYLQMVDLSRRDHRRLRDIEQETVEFTHMEAGAALGARWRLPDVLNVAIRFHHESHLAPQPHRDVVRLVEVATLAAEAIVPSQPPDAAAKFFEACTTELGLDLVVAAELFERLSDDARMLSRALDLDTGPSADVQGLMRQAKALRAGVRRPLAPSFDQRAA